MQAPASPTIDIHGHFVPPALMTRILDRPSAGVSVIHTGDDRYNFDFSGASSTRTLPPMLIDLVERERWMDDQGIDIQVLSTWADVFGYALDAAAGLEWSLMLNDTLMEAIAGSNRFLAFSSLPMQDPDGAVGTLERSLQDGFVGVTVAARVGEVELDDQRYESFWSAASDLAAVVLIHPGFEPGDPRTADYGLVNAVGRGSDTTIAAARLLYAGVPVRFPGVRIILSHGGGTLPYLMGRLRRNHAINPSLHDPDEGFRRLFFDSVVFEPGTLRFLLDRAGAESVLLGSDYPFPIGDPRPIDVVASTDLTDGERHSVLGDGAAALLNLEAYAPPPAKPEGDR